MTNAEARLLRFLSASRSQGRWVSERTIRNTEDLLPGDEEALPALVSRRLVEANTSDRTYRVTETGLKVIGRGRDAM